MFILMCVQQKEINRPFILLKKKKKDLQNAMRKCWQSGSVTLCYTHTHRHLLLLPSSSSQAQFFQWDLFASHKEFTVARRSPSSEVDTS